MEGHSRAAKSFPQEGKRGVIVRRMCFPQYQNIRLHCHSRLDEEGATIQEVARRVGRNGRIIFIIGILASVFFVCPDGFLGESYLLYIFNCLRDLFTLAYLAQSVCPCLYKHCSICVGIIDQGKVNSRSKQDKRGSNPENFAFLHQPNQLCRRGKRKRIPASCDLPSPSSSPRHDYFLP